MPRGSGLGSVVTDLVDRRGQSVVLVRSGAALDAQDMVLDIYVLGAGEVAMIEAASGQAGLTSLKIIGGTDLDIDRGDQFVAGDLQYRVVLVSPPDGVQRIAYAQGLEH